MNNQELATKIAQRLYSQGVQGPCATSTVIFEELERERKRTEAIMGMGIAVPATSPESRLADRATQIACAELEHFSLAEAELEGIAIRSIELAREIERLASHNRPTATLTTNPSPDTPK